MSGSTGVMRTRSGRGRRRGGDVIIIIADYQTGQPALTSSANISSSYFEQIYKSSTNKD